MISMITEADGHARRGRAQLTSRVPVDQEEFEEEENPVLWTDGDEPVTELTVRWVLGRVTGAGDDSVLLSRDVLSAIFCCRMSRREMDGWMSDERVSSG